MYIDSNLAKQAQPKPSLVLPLIFFLLAVPYLLNHQPNPPSAQTDKIKPFQPSEINDKHRLDISAPERRALEFVERFKFVQKPNFYTLLYDSLIPPEIAQLFFGKVSSEYRSLFRDRLIRPPDITAQRFVSSLPSIESVMWLDLVDTLQDSTDFFAGRQESPFSKMFKANGYEITTGNHWAMWGEVIGSHIDKWLHKHSKPSRLVDSLLCVDHTTGAWSSLRGAGICGKVGGLAGIPPLSVFWRELRTAPVETSYSDLQPLRPPGETWHDVVKSHIATVSASDSPHATFIYTFSPIGHTTPEYDHSDAASRAEYIDSFYDNSIWAARLISELADFIERTDPTAVVIIAGDHGAYLSRTSEKEWDEGFQYIDRHLVGLGVLDTGNPCVKALRSSGFKPHSRQLHTISSVILTLAHCLSGIEEYAGEMSAPLGASTATIENFARSKLTPEVVGTLPNQIDTSQTHDTR